jgi:hypothetical protein
MGAQGGAVVTTYYKVLDENGESVNGGKGKWPLPKDGRPGRWKTVRGKLIPCKHALHGCTANQLPEWLGPVIYEMEYDGEVQDHGDKSYGAKARLLLRMTNWTETSARMFAADCVERGLLQERKAGREPDTRSWAAVGAARAFAQGEISSEELASAYACASYAYACASASAYACASSAERKWEAERLMTYLRGEIPAPVTVP